MTTQIESLKRAVARWNAGDLDGYLNLYAPQIKLHGYSPEPMGREAVAGFYAMIFASLHAQGRSSPEITIDDVFEIGSRVVCRATMKGNHAGEFMGARPTGRPYAISTITYMDFVGDKVVERWSCADLLGILIQVGAIAPPQG